MVPVYYINLAARADRRAFMEGQLQAASIPGTRIEAISVDQLSADERRRFCNPQRTGYLLGNQLACSKSHELAWESILRDGHEQALVLEDDAVFSSRLREFLTQLGEHPYSVIRIEAVPSARRYLPPELEVTPGIVLRKCRSAVGGSAGYVITAEAIRQLTGLRELRRDPIDVVLFHPFRPVGRLLDIVQSDPGLCIQLAARKGYDDAVARGEPSELPPGVAEIDRVRLRQHWRNRLVDWASIDIQKSVDHLRNLGKGISKQEIPFLE